MQFSTDLEELKNDMNESLMTNSINTTNYETQMTLIAIAERLEAIALELEKKNVHPNMEKS